MNHTQWPPLAQSDPEIYQIIQHETQRQAQGLELIASENFVSPAVLSAMGSSLTNKYAEGYPGKRYYGGCQWVDEAENLAVARVQKLFGADYANVQPHSGSQANMAVYFSCLKPGDTILAMNLAHGGHLTHGHSVNFSGKLYNIVSYGVNPKNFCLDFNEIEKLAKAHKPRLIIAGASAYSRAIDYQAFRHIADQVGALLMADMAHPAGLIAAKLLPSPIPYCDFVTSTTHKTLRGPRGGLILARNSDHLKAVRSTVFPGIQGGPLMHVIAAKAVAFGENLHADFVTYSKAIIANAQALSQSIIDAGFDVLTGGTDNHLLLVDLRQHPITGAEAENALSRVEITVNKNMLPFDQRPPTITSGLRLGTPALTSRGMGVKEMQLIGSWIGQILKQPQDQNLQKQIHDQVLELTRHYPLYAQS